MSTEEYKEIKEDLKKIVGFLNDNRIYYHGNKLTIDKSNY